LTAAQKFIAEMQIGPSGLVIAGGVDRANRTYRPGEPMTVSVRVNKDAYVAVLRVRRSGETTLLFPNRLQPKAAVVANTSLQIPASDTAAPLTAGKTSPELIEIVAATAGGSWLFTKAPSGDAAFVELGATTRALAKEIATSLRSHGGSETAAASQIVLIRPN